jgi:pimeloyl-ACP methyl ester carboxylesterase/DNA-binding CsgD family transcriptional regulator
MAQGVRFCASRDGVQIGYSTFGQGRPLVIVPGWWMSPEADRRRLIGRDFWNDLPAAHRTITYDLRGIGVSGRDVRDVSLERQVEDLQAVVDHLKLSSFDLWCFADATSTGVTYAVRHPERVARLILYNPFAFVPGSVARHHIEVWSAFVRADWNLASRMFAELLYPKGPLDAQEASTKAIRETQSPEVAIRYLESVNTFDVREDLGRLALPVLVISREGPGRTPLVPIETVRLVAAAIPGARFVAYEAAPAVCPYFDYRMYHGIVCQFLTDGTREMPLHPTLSPRELEVLDLVAHGKTNGEIAELLSISRNTADRHVSNILAKTGSSNRAEAALYAARHSLVS